MPKSDERYKVPVTCPICKEERMATPSNRFDKSKMKLCKQCTINQRRSNFKVGKAKNE